MIHVLLDERVDSKYKKPLYSRAWLETALHMEIKKYRKVPITGDLVNMNAQSWGYVFTGYRLLECVLKFLIISRKEDSCPTGHRLTILYEDDAISDKDRDIMESYYVDYCRGKFGGFPFGFCSLIDFLDNLDKGYSDWSYFLIENSKKGLLPRLSIDVLHEVIRGCLSLARRPGPGKEFGGHPTHSWQLYKKRWSKGGLLRTWLMVRLGLRDHAFVLEGTDVEGITVSGSRGDSGYHVGNRIEVLMGPDHAYRYDFAMYVDGEVFSEFDLWPQNADSVPVEDLRKDVEAFDFKAGLAWLNET